MIRSDRDRSIEAIDVNSDVDLSANIPAGFRRNSVSSDVADSCVACIAYLVRSQRFAVRPVVVDCFPDITAN